MARHTDRPPRIDRTLINHPQTRSSSLASPRGVAAGPGQSAEESPQAPEQPADLPSTQAPADLPPARSPWPAPGQPSAEQPSTRPLQAPRLSRTRCSHRRRLDSQIRGPRDGRRLGSLLQSHGVGRRQSRAMGGKRPGEERPSNRRRGRRLGNRCRSSTATRSSRRSTGSRDRRHMGSQAVRRSTGSQGRRRMGSRGCRGRMRGIRSTACLIRRSSGRRRWHRQARLSPVRARRRGIGGGGRSSGRWCSGLLAIAVTLIVVTVWEIVHAAITGDFAEPEGPNSPLQQPDRGHRGQPADARASSPRSSC